ncbi:hypothetical protein TSUD_57280 [Trifolium subterraneum]|uniref:RNase H type-1 domain-containing protein n=1 Tax=Trifolium subterraneum TaxID=3900 RepID=A0A2Z6NV14_TRISU|nr:hypothetical protein TSUD_57280 [Trifolium subterraneum]
MWGAKVWNSHKIQSFFSDTTTESILRTPVFEEVKEDQLVWQYENHGKYTVKFGHPQKPIIYFGEYVGVAYHPNESRSVWNEAGLRGVIEPRVQQLNNVHNAFFDICRNETFDVVGTVAMIAWCIWNNRNNCVWNGLKDTPKCVAMHVAHVMNEWRAVNIRQQLRQTEDNNTTGIQWQQPRSGWSKCNVDASCHYESGRTGWGWCFRNSHGAFIAACTNVSMHKFSTLEGEAMTLLEAIREASFRGWSNIVFESDSKIVVDALQTNHTGVSELSSIFMSIKSLLHCNSNFEIKFIKRQANMVAHTLARAVISWSSRKLFDYVPL